MKTAEIRQRYLDFFAQRGHTVVPSASLVSDDPTLMFTVAGMVPFVPYMSGLVPAPYPSATSVQKCIRTNDIEEVGRTPRHGTFFQMCGNFSFGDYFKEGAIRYAWEFLTTPEDQGGLGFSPDDLWVTVYKDDDEAASLWREISGLPEERIQRLDKDTNYWSTGQPGPAGPCSEIFFDRGPDYGADGGPATDDDRYVEIWNLVFMQYEITDVKSKTDFTVVGELPKKNIDTGMGLERIAFLKQGVENMYEIDQVRPVLDKAAEIAGIKYGQSEQDDVRLRVIADHVRSGLMLICDGVTPSNGGRGYILRRLLRRVVLAMRLMGVEKPVFTELFTVSRDAMAAAYPEVVEKFDFIVRTAAAEEQTFLRTLSGGMQILDKAISQAKSVQQPVAGDAAFLLHDTHGFPIELTLELADEAGITVDQKKFTELLQEQRDRAKSDAKSKKGQKADLSVYQDLRKLGETSFLGYEEFVTEGRVLGIITDGKPVSRLSEGQTGELILSETTLWAEGGGQDSDHGEIRGDGFSAEVLDVQKPVQGLISHTVRVNVGEVGIDDTVQTHVDAAYRYGAQQAHSATHVVHAALRQILGEQAQQAGSYNRAGYLRFDFAWPESLSKETRSEIEDLSNQAIQANHEVITREMSLDEAKELGAMMLFTEKYGDTVRMVEIGGPWSRELCAGTHVAKSSEIGLINLVSESSIGSANRRLESLVGFDAFKSFAAERMLVSELSSGLNVKKSDLSQRVQELSAQLKEAEKQLNRLNAAKLQQQIPQLLASAQQVGSVTAVVSNIGEVASADDIRQLTQQLLQQLSADGVAVLFGIVNAKPLVVAAVSEQARKAGVQAGLLVREAAKTLGGGGGGKPDIAQGGGQDPAAIERAITAVWELLR